MPQCKFFHSVNQVLYENEHENNTVYDGHRVLASLYSEANGSGLELEARSPSFGLLGSGVGVDFVFHS